MNTLSTNIKAKPNTAQINGKNLYDLNNKKRYQTSEFQLTAGNYNVGLKERRIFSVGKYKNIKGKNRNNNLETTYLNTINFENFNKINHNNQFIRENSKNRILDKKITNKELKNIGQKSKSVSMFKIKGNKLNEKDSATNINIKTLKNEKDEFVKNNLNEENSTKYKNLDLDDLIIQNQNYLIVPKLNANEDIIDNLNEKFKRLNDSTKQFECENFDIVDHVDLRIEKKEIELSNNEYENFIISKRNNSYKNYETNDNNNSNSEKSNGNFLLQNGRNSKSKNFISNNRPRNSEVVINYPTTNRKLTQNELNIKTKNNATATDLKDINENQTNKPFAKINQTIKKENTVEINSSSLKRFIVIGGYPAIREALVKRNWVELNDNERYF